MRKFRVCQNSSNCTIPLLLFKWFTTQKKATHKYLSTIILSLSFLFIFIRLSCYFFFTLTAIILMWERRKRNNEKASNFYFKRESLLFRNIVKKIVGNKCKQKRQRKLLPCVTCMFLQCHRMWDTNEKDFLFKTRCTLHSSPLLIVIIIIVLKRDVNNFLKRRWWWFSFANMVESRSWIHRNLSHCTNSIITYLHKWCDSCLLSLSLNVMNFQVIKWSTMMPYVLNS